MVCLIILGLLGFFNIPFRTIQEFVERQTLKEVRMAKPSVLNLASLITVDYRGGLV